ncbi:MAG: hypothetical protein JO250_02310 [Armatimonadetes bacterium]|nr:hypothetical protein [Armatimonadota bacterium]
MRFLLKISMPVEAANETIRAGTLPKVIGAMLQDLKPEAAYFVAIDGQRTGLIFFDMQDPSQIPAVAEPAFLAFNAHVELTPAMTIEDLQKAMPGIEQAVQKYG